MGIGLVHKLLAVAEVYHEDLVGLLAQSDQEVVRADVTVGQIRGMHPLHPVEDLVNHQQHRLEGELAPAEEHQLLQRRAVHIRHQHAEVVLDSVPVEVGEASWVIGLLLPPLRSR